MVVVVVVVVVAFILLNRSFQIHVVKNYIDVVENTFCFDLGVPAPQFIYYNSKYHGPFEGVC